MRLVRQVVKTLIHCPWYAASIVGIVGVACALLTTVVAVVDGVLLKPLGYPGEQHLVAIKVSSTRSRSTPVVNNRDLVAWPHGAPGVAFTGFLVHPGRAAVQSNFFDVIGVRPVLGGFAPEDFEGGTVRIEPRILTDEVFRSQFGGDPGAMGRIVIVDPSRGSGYRIVGVMPAGFVFPTYQWSVGYLVPFSDDRYFSFNHLVARVPADLTASELRLRVIAAATASRGPNTNSTDRPSIDEVEVEPLGRALGAASRPLFAALLAGACILVAIAALNASSLMAARSVDRAHELGVRRALGATPGDIAALLLVEAVLLVGAGATLGLVIAAPLLRFAVPLLPENLALFKAVAIDGRVVASAVIVAMVIAPLVAAGSLRLARARKTTLEPSRGVTSHGRSLSRTLVVAVQVALALVLTVEGSLLVGSLLSVYAQTPTITTRNIQTISLSFLGIGSAASRLSPERTARVNALLERVRRVPGVDAVALTAYDLLDRAYVRSWFIAPATAVNPRQAMLTQAVTGDYYRILQPQLVAGRVPTAVELASDASVIVVSERVASNYWPNASAIGQTLTDQGWPGEAARMFMVVGVVKDVRWHSWDQAALPMIYGPYALLARLNSSALLIRTSSDISRVSADTLRAIRETDPLVRTGRVAPLGELFVDSVRPRRLRAWLFGSFAGASLFVVGIGIFGQLSISTARRTREVGIRMTCGATRISIVSLILSEQLVPVVAGLIAGGIGTAWAVGWVSSYLYQLTTSDIRVWAGAVGLILFTAAAGTLVPALRASRIDPMQALKAE